MSNAFVGVLLKLNPILSPKLNPILGKNPKELINDYDYCDYIIDEENDWSTFSYNLEVEHRDDRKETLAKMRRK